jgi:hypothetical protein
MFTFHWFKVILAPGEVGRHWLRRVPPLPIHKNNPYMNHQIHNKLVNFIWSIADENMHILVRDFRQGLRNHRQIRVSQIFM